MGVSSVWQHCLRSLEKELSAQQFINFIRPLQIELSDSSITLLAPNRIVRDKVDDDFRALINEVAQKNGIADVKILVGSSATPNAHTPSRAPASHKGFINNQPSGHNTHSKTVLNKTLTFDSFVVGSANELAHASALQVSKNLGRDTKSLFLYGGVGLGKTHLMHSVGNAMLVKNTHLKVACMYAKDFTVEMVRAIQTGAMNEFTNRYHALDVLLVDDIQFLIKGKKSQEEFFHIFNRLQEKGSQIVFTCDRYPKELDALEERLKSRFLWCRSARLDPPDEETRVAILLKKAEFHRINLPYQVAVFIAKKIRSNVRELEGALTKVDDNAKFTHRDITIDQVKDALHDVLRLQAEQVGIENIQKTVVEYYKIKMSDMHSKRRNQSVVRPRQIAMALAKKLTNHSLPEIGESFGGRDHTTVIHACKRIEELKETHRNIREDYNKILTLLTY